MRRYLLGITAFIVLTIALTTISWVPMAGNTAKHDSLAKADTVAAKESLYQTYLKRIYNTAHLAETGLRLNVFEMAVTGFYNLKKSGKLSSDKSVVTIADMDLNSTRKRLWIVDLENGTLLLNTWVAHGQRSGDDKAINFSNTSDSHQSSLGFYVTGEIYNGQHGRSLRLDGMDEGFNSNARRRDIVVHGASYVSAGTIKALGRLGRSHGCPAIAPELTNKVINTIGGKTLLFINSSDKGYTSKYLDEQSAATLASSTTFIEMPQNLQDSLDI